MNLMPHRQLPISPQDAESARASELLLSRYAKKNVPLNLSVTDGDQTEQIKLPSAAVTLLMVILKTMAAERGVTVFPENVELTTAEAAEVLMVSRPFLIKLLDEQKIPYRKVGKNRRIRMEDVMGYKIAADARRERILDELVADAQEQGGMGYDLP